MTERKRRAVINYVHRKSKDKVTPIVNRSKENKVAFAACIKTLLPLQLHVLHYAQNDLKLAYDILRVTDILRREPKNVEAQNDLINYTNQFIAFLAK